MNLTENEPQKTQYIYKKGILYLYETDSND